MTAINLLARGYRVQVSTDDTNWVRPMGLNSLSASFDPNVEDSSDYDNEGWSSGDITMRSWSLEIGLNRKSDGGVEDPGQTLIDAAQAEFGDAARLYVRWYRTDGIGQSWKGRAVVGVAPDGTSVTDLAKWNVTLTGDGAPTKIANPYTPTAAPVVLSASPSGAAAGAQVTIKGQGFTGTVASTGVKFGATAATSWTVVSDSLIVAIVPTGSAGSAAVTVTNATGASNALAYTRA